MLQASRGFYRLGHNEVRIGVEADTAAQRLYEQLGMKLVQQYDEYQKRIGRGRQMASHQVVIDQDQPPSP